jgi:uncharacterized protein with von Willebrand factor type A (vWA) domain
MKLNRISFAAMALALSVSGAVSGTASAKPRAAANEGEVRSYILLDRTGSMSDIWAEALGSVNAYAKSVGEADAGEIDGADIETRVTLAVFDHQDTFQFDVLRKNVAAENWNQVTDDEASPRGMTPLFDAIGRIVTLAERDAPEKAVIVIMTDGMENASSELTREGARQALDRARNRGWEVVFLGTEFANFGDAEGVGNASSKNMAVGKDQMSGSMSDLAKKSRAYGKGEAPEIVFAPEDRAKADEEGVKERTGGNR